MRKSRDIKGFDASEEELEADIDDGIGREVQDTEAVAQAGVEMDITDANSEAHGDAELPGGEDEAQAPRAARAPSQPSAKEVELHELTHCPPRTWCEHCVRGQMKDLPHRTATGEFSESSVTRVSMDYCYLTEDVKAAEDDHGTSETAKKSMTVLVMKETLCQSVGVRRRVKRRQ